MTIRVAPSVLSADFGHLHDEVVAIDRAGADYIHVDVMDGHYVPNLTFGPPVIRAVRRATPKPLDVHLMITNAERYLGEYVDAGADMVTVHAEAVGHLHAAVHRIRSLGAKPGVSLNPATPISAIEHVLPDIDMVLIMTVNPGFGGQSFIETMIPKIRRLRGLISERKLAVDIEVDGGIKPDNVATVVSAGANVLVSGSGIFGAESYADAIATMRRNAATAG